MAKEIDEKIVKMTFEDSKFNSSVDKVIRSLDKLNKTVDNMGQDVQGIDTLIDGLDRVQKKFDVLSNVAEGAMERIGARIADTGMRLAKSLSVDQVTAGWSKYEEKTRAVKTIMNATGESIGTVNEYLDKLMWYTDETSYNFVDMTSNIGKFTSQGIALDKATSAMMGISNWAAQAGQGANEAARAMYNLSQAIGVGSVKLMDWMSVENANMGTKEFKELAIETAKELGTLSEAAETAKGDMVTFSNFRETLKDEWFTSDVLIATLQKYSDYTEEVYKLVQSEGISAAEAMERLGDAYDGVGKKAFQAGQVSKTLADAIDATKDAVSSRWLAIFETIFGNLETQEVWWTQVTSRMYDAFADGLDSLLVGFREWESLDGPIEFLKSLDVFLGGIVGVIQIFGNAWEKAFGPITGESIGAIATAIGNLFRFLAPTELALDSLSSIFGGLMSIVNIGTSYIMAFAKGFEPLATFINYTIGTIVNLLGFGGDLVTTFGQWASSEEKLIVVTETVRTVVQGFVDVLKGAILVVAAIGKTFYDAFSQLNFSWENGITGIDKFADVVKTNFKEIFGAVMPSGFSLDSVFEKLATVFSNISNKVQGPLSAITKSIANVFESLKSVGQNGSAGIIQGIGEAFNEAGAFIEKASHGLLTVSTILGNILGPLGSGIKDFISYLSRHLGELSTSDIFDLLLVMNVGKIIKPIQSIGDAFSEAISDISEAMVETLGSIGDTLESFQAKVKTQALLNIAKAVGILAASIWILSKVPIEQIGATAAVLGGLTTAIGFVMYFINDFTDSWDDDRVTRFSNTLKSLIPLAATIGLLAISLKSLSSLPLADLAKGVGAITILMGELAGFIKIMSTFKKKFTLEGKGLSELIALSLALKLLVGPVKKLGALDLETLAKGLGAVGIALAELAGFMYLAGFSKANMTNVGAGLILLAGALAILTPEILAISLISWDTLIGGLTRLAAMMVVFSGAMAGLSLAGTAGLAGAAGMAALSIALAALIPQIAIISLFEWETIGKAILTFAGVLGTFVAAAWLLSPVAPIFVALSGGLTALNLSIGVILVSLSALAKAAPVAVAGFVLWAQVSQDTIQNGCKNIELLLSGLIDVVIGLKVKLRTAMLMFLRGMIEAISEIGPDIVNGLAVLIDEVLLVLEEKLPGIMEKLDNLLTEMEPYVDKFAEHACKIVSGFISGFIKCLWDGFGIVVENVGKWLDSVFLNGSIQKRNERIATWYGKEGQKIVTDNAKSWAKDNQMAITRAQQDLEKTAKETGVSVQDAFYKGMDERADRHSPPKETEKSAEDNRPAWLIGIKNILGSIFDSGKEFVGAFFGGADSEIDFGVEKTVSKTEKTFNTAVENSNLGKSVGEKISKTISEDTSAEEAAKKKAEKIAEIFDTEFEKIDVRLSKVGSSYGIAEAYLGPDAKEEEVNLLKLEQLQKEMRILADKYILSYNEYQDTMARPNVSDLDIDKSYKEYLAVYEELAKKANEVAAQQKTMYGSYEEAEKMVMQEVQSLAQAQASLFASTKVVYSEETNKALEDFKSATTDQQKEYYNKIYQELMQQDREAILGKELTAPIDVNQIRAEVYKNLGLDPSNPITAFTSVKDIIQAAVNQAKETYMQGVVATYPGIIQAYETEIAQSAAEVIEFTEEAVAPDFRRSGEMMSEAASEGVELSASKVSYQGKMMSKNAAQTVNENKGDWTEVGKEMMYGVTEGIRQNRSEVINAAVEVAEAALQAAKQAMGISSPSKEFLAVGMYAMEGLAIGIVDLKDDVAMRSRDVANTMIDQFSGVNSQVHRVLDESLHPVIEPSIDLTGVKRGVKSLDNLWSSGTLQTISDISLSELNRRDEVLQARRPVTPITKNEVQFTQNNYSPKSLTDAEIYLDTKKALNWRFKGAVK